MAAFKSIQLTNRDAVPSVLNTPATAGDRVKQKIAYVAKGTETDGSTWRFMSIPSSALITSIHYCNTAIAGFTAINIGLYDTTANGGAVVSAALFGSALDLHLAAAWTDLTLSVTTIDKIEKRVWELLGLSADPMKEYDLVWVGTTAGANTGKLGTRVAFNL